MQTERQLIGTSLEDDPTFDPWRLVWQNTGVSREQMETALLLSHGESCLNLADLLLAGDYSQDPQKREKQFDSVIHTSVCPEGMCQIGNRFFEGLTDRDEIGFKADISHWKHSVAELPERIK